MSGMMNCFRYISIVLFSCALLAPLAAEAATTAPGSFHEAASASSGLGTEQVKTGQLATFTPRIEMRAVETKVFVNGEMRTIVHYVPYASQKASMKGMSSSVSAKSPQDYKDAPGSSSAKVVEPTARNPVKRRRKTALHRVIQEPEPSLPVREKTEKR